VQLGRDREEEKREITLRRLQKKNKSSHKEEEVEEDEEDAVLSGTFCSKATMPLQEHVVHVCLK
jgi:hypothetical protein